jgi:hypothetical protein
MVATKYYQSMRTFFASVLIGATAFGCAPKDEFDSSITPANPATSQVDLLDPTASTDTRTGQTSTSAAPEEAAIQAMDFSASDRMENEKGQPMTDLELLNYAVHVYTARVKSEVPILQGQFKTQDEEVAAYEAAMKRQGGGIRDLSELVKAGIIKSIPAPPPGKVYALDATGVVVLKDAR